MHKSLKTEEKKSEVKLKIQNQCIKMYVTKKMEMVNNIDTINANIWGAVYISPTEKYQAPQLIQCETQR